MVAPVATSPDNLSREKETRERGGGGRSVAEVDKRSLFGGVTGRNREITCARHDRIAGTAAGFDDDGDDDEDTIRTELFRGVGTGIKLGDRIMTVSAWVCVDGVVKWRWGDTVGFGHLEAGRGEGRIVHVEAGRIVAGIFWFHSLGYH